jgi:hypothetical protein
MWMWYECILLNRPILSKMTLLEYESGNPFIDFYGWYYCLPIAHAAMTRWIRSMIALGASPKNGSVP